MDNNKPWVGNAVANQANKAISEILPTPKRNQAEGPTLTDGLASLDYLVGACWKAIAELEDAIRPVLAYPTNAVGAEGVDPQRTFASPFEERIWQIDNQLSTLRRSIDNLTYRVKV